MKSKYLIIVFLLTVFSCSKDEVEIPQPFGIFTVKITAPTNPEPLGPNQGVTFKGVVSAGPLTDLTKLSASWVSDKDGLFFESGLNKQGETSFFTDKLSKNIHRITLNITSVDGDVVSDVIEISNAIQLLPITKTNNAATITWCSVQDPNFYSYALYRSTSKNSILQNAPIYVTNNIQDTTFIDTTALLGQENFYQVFLKRTSVLPQKVGSNFQSIVAGQFIETDYPLLKVIPDATRNYAYGIVNTSSLYDQNQTNYGIVFINLNTFEVESRILQNIRFSDIDIDPSGNSLYACSRSNTIHKINLNTRTLASTITLYESAHKIEVGTNNKLYYHITPPTSGSTEFRIYDLASAYNVPYSTTIPAASSSFRHGDFEIDQNNNLYHGGSNTSSARLSKLGTTSNTFSLINQFNGGSYSRDKIILNNSKLYWDHRVYDLNLNPLGIFLNNFGPTDIQAVSPNGNYALSWANLFNSNDQTMLKEIPAQYDDGIFANDSQLLLYKNKNPIYQQYECKIFLYDF